MKSLLAWGAVPTQPGARRHCAKRPSARPDLPRPSQQAQIIRFGRGQRRSAAGTPRSVQIGGSARTCQELDYSQRVTLGLGAARPDRRIRASSSCEDSARGCLQMRQSCAAPSGLVACQLRLDDIQALVRIDPIGECADGVCCGPRWRTRCRGWVWASRPLRACRPSRGHRVQPQRRQLHRKLAHGGVQPTLGSCQLVALRLQGHSGTRRLAASRLAAGSAALGRVLPHTR